MFGNLEQDSQESETLLSGGENVSELVAVSCRDVCLVFKIMELDVVSGWSSFMEGPVLSNCIVSLTDRRKGT